MNPHIIVVFILIFLGCKPTPQKQFRYYTNITGVASPYLEYAPQGEINKQKADSLGRYYIFTYESEKLSEISFFKRNEPSSQSYFRTHKVSYTYYKRSLIRSYYNEDGTRSNMWRHYYQGGDIHKEKYALDDTGRKTSLIFKDSTGQRVSSGDGVYKFVWSHISETEILQKHLDSLGKPIEFRKDIPFKRLKLKVDQRGYSLSLTRVNEDNQAEDHPTDGYATLRLLFDEYGNEIGWEHRDKSGELVNLPNEFGHSQWLYEKKYLDKKLGIVASFTESYYDKEGKRVQNSDSVHQIQYKLNSFGELTSLKYFNTKLKKQVHLSSGFFRAEIRYDSIGNRVSVSKYDTTGGLLN